MYVVRLDWFSRIAGRRVEWFCSQAAAYERARALLDGGEIVGRGIVTRVDVPHARRLLVDWLNDNLRSANA